MNVIPILIVLSCFGALMGADFIFNIGIDPLGALLGACIGCLIGLITTKGGKKK